MRDPSPLIVTGMHRSRTSSIALLLDRLGVDMGRDQLPADRWNPEGYGEERRIVALHREVLHRHAGQADPSRSWIDWGWPMQPPVPVPDDLASEMVAYLTWRSSTVRPDAAMWGWKEPRTTLFLASWASLAPSAVFLLLYRHPVGVRRSMERLEFPPALLRQSFSMWAQYNEAILAFMASHRERSALIESGAALRGPMRLLRLLRDRLGVALTPARLAAAVDIVRPDLLDRSQDEDSLPDELPAGVQSLWTRLNELADAT